ncbi:S9 family peptidase [Streptacidiphilus sp. P02-A3a]|uniref:S9 family peptidase n=1 Tax=Streptacidiphilus sp. P02-A3a TaxID=2704468 RepID=UPI0015F9A36E|nr:S9 family peptidase [Streptacidiphilus sp. P02-A3a]QMU69845.1 S9 family peptidase [Streptacidiphilus sp. P02-A3a]
MPNSAFTDLSEYITLPRLSGLALAPDGTRLVTTVQELSADGTRYLSALWEIDPAGARAPRRLTRSAKGESGPAFLPDGTLLFRSARPGADLPEGEDEAGESALWALPPGGGEAARVVTRPGGVNAHATARAAERLAFAGSLMPGAESVERDAELRRARTKAKVTAILHEGPMVRYWDHDLGPARPHVFAAERPGAEAVDCGVGAPWEQAVAVSADGSLIAYNTQLTDDPEALRDAVVVADAATGKRLRLLAQPQGELSDPVFTPDGRQVICGQKQQSSYEETFDRALWLFDATDEGDPGRPLLPGSELWPGTPVVSPVPGPDGELVLFFAADERGHCPVFRLDVHPDGRTELTRLTAAGAHTNLQVAPDGRTVYALRAAVDAPPAPVRLDGHTPDQDPVPLPTPGAVGALPGVLTEVHASAEDGTALRAWLVLPEGATAEQPAPLLLWVHGGPQHSWNSWQWRWNPWIAAARGYAVLLPDPALSTGYGARMHERGWGDWGGAPYTDVMALTDAALERPELDGRRTAMMGGSFGGFMANLIATRTDRFRAIVSHAGLWNLETFGGSTDAPFYWRRAHGDPLTTRERYQAYSPHLGAARISTPMLVIHGDRDYRVPIGEALGLWNDLVRFEVPAKFLYFPDEGHWILKPSHVRLWYQTVFNFLAHHVLDAEWVRPDLV